MLKFRNSRSEALVQPYHFNKDSMVQEQFAYDCDINNIVAGMTSPIPTRTPLSDTIDEVKRFSPDMYEQALLVKASAENAFNELPSDIRTFFDNDPGKMLSFVSDPKNTDKCVELGLMTLNQDRQAISDLNTNLNNPVKAPQISSVTDGKTVETVTPSGSQGD